MSKELEALEVLKLLKDFLNGIELGNVDKLYVGGSLNIIKSALEALEIIKTKKVDYLKLEDCIVNMQLDEPFYYNQGMSEEYHLTQEEYNLLKEMLK